MIPFFLESLSRALSNAIGFTFKLIQSAEILPKQSNAAVESESKYRSKGVASSSFGSMGLVRARVRSRL